MPTLSKGLSKFTHHGEWLVNHVNTLNSDWQSLTVKDLLLSELPQTPPNPINLLWIDIT